MSILTSIGLKLLGILIVIGSFAYLIRENRQLKQDVSVQTNNNKSLERGMLTYKLDNGKLLTASVEQQQSIAALKNTGDSTTTALLKRIAGYKIKLNDVVSVGTIHTKLVHDTTVVMGGKDTTWNLGTNPQTIHTVALKGNELSDHLEITNDEDVVMHGQKETIDPPKKFFIWRWFQRKQLVVSGEVINSNTDIHVTGQKFIKILK